MKQIILPATIFLCSLISLQAQKKSNKAFAITSEKKGAFVWTEVKLIDLNTGEVLQNVFENRKGEYNVFDARTGKPIKVKYENGTIPDNNKLPFSTFSAACAYDKKHNRLYYTPMFINQLRYIDLNAKSPKIYYFEGEHLSVASDLRNEANHVTRMVIGADGNGYALNNDATHLLKFTTGRKPVITDLGSLNDDPRNGKVSVRNRRTSWGGDMVADVEGNLYMISAYRSVFKVDVKNKIATYLGNIEGLPANFTTNGAVIGNDGNLVVGSANSIEGYFKVDMVNWKATRLETNGQVFNASDLANGNLAFEKQQAVPRLINRSIVRNSRIAIYPNPVSEGMFRISFDNDDPGRYNVQLVDLLGKVVSEKILSIGHRGQVEEVQVSNKLAKGMYLVKVLNHRKKTVYADKIIVE